MLMICFGFLVSSVFAQTGVVNNGAKMIVNTGAIMKITGSGADYTNATDGGTHGRVDLDGKIELEGDWINNASSGGVMINLNTDGLVLFNGSALQNITGSASTQFENLTINNTSGLSLSSSIGVRNILTLTNGLFTLNSNNLNMGYNGSVSGTFSSTRMIVINNTGSLRKAINSTGTFTFPIGEVTGTPEYSPVDFELTGTGGFSSAWVGAHVTDAKHAENTSPSEYLTRYWTLTSSGITSPVYSADFNYLQADVVGTEVDIYAAEYDGAAREVYSIVNAGSNILNVTGLSNFADYTGVDGTAPTTVITTTESDPTNASPIPFKVTFSETVTGFVSGEIDVTNGTVSNFNTAANPEFTFDITPTGQGEITVDVAGAVAKDAAGNDNTAATQYAIEFDSTNPTVAITSTEPDPTNTNVDITITFNEEISGFVSGDITVGNGSVTGFVEQTVGLEYDVIVTPAGDGLVTVDINAGVANDAAGNGNDAATQYSVLYDGTDPDVTLTSTELDPTNTDPFILTIEFNEGVTDFALTDLTLSNCAAGNFIEVKTDTTFTVEISPTTNGTVTVDLNAGKAYDYAGNPNTAASQFSIVYDGTNPTVTITSAETDPTNTTPFQITITFNENMSGFDLTDITVGNGSAGNLLNPTPNQVWTADITPTGAGTVTVDVDADAATDAAGNGNTAAIQYSITFDNANPIATYSPADDATDVSISADLEINFDEPVNAVSGNISLYETTGDVLVETFDVTIDISGDGTSTITIDPTSDLSSATDYYVQIASSAFDDDAGNSFAGISDKITWNFTSADVNNPYITSTSPSDNAVDVSLTTNLEITFSEDVIKGTGNITIENETDATTHETIDVTSGQVSIVNNVVTINPGTDFDGEKDYYILIADGAFEDATSNAFPGISNPATWNFTSEDVAGPIVDNLSPADDAIDVVIDSDLEITFDEPITKGAGNIVITNAAGPTVHETIDVLSGQVTAIENTVTINPSIDFDGESVYYVEMASGVITDTSSNMNDFAGISGSTTWNFTTEDVAEPTVVVSTAEASPTNSSPFSVTITFNEQVQNFTAGDVSVTNGTPSNLSTGDNITFTVDITPAGEGDVDVIVPAGVAQDLAGNSNEVSNQISLEYDITSPTVIITTAESDPTNSSPFDVTITFNEGIVDLVTGNITVGNGTVNNVSNVTPDTVWTANITPTADGTVTVDILADEVTDIAGNGNIASDQFTIEYDASGPEITLLSPLDGAIDISVTENLQITFDEIVNLNTGYYLEIRYQSDNALFESIDVTTLSGDGTNTVTINPSIDFDSETTYYVLIDAQAFIDDLGNGFAGISSTTDWEFTTADVEAPTVNSVSPVDGAVDIAVDTDLSITFSEDVNKNVGSITIMDADADLEYEVIDVTTGQVTVVSNVATINPSVDLESEVNYYILVGQSTFQDLAGNNFDGITASTDWNFLTEDLNPPVITAVSPLDNAIDITLTTDLEITFDENVAKGTGNIIIRNATADTVYETIDVTSGQVIVASNVVTINPSIDFVDQTDYYILIASGALVDESTNANDFGGIADQTTWNFTTGDFTAPIVNTLSPLDNAIDVSVNSNLVITFNEDVDKGSGNITIYDITAGATHEIISVASAQVTVAFDQVTIDPSVNFASESEYYVLVENGAFQDESGNDYGGISSTTEWTFTVEDINPPTVSSLSPVDDATGVSIVTDLELTFNEDVIKGTGLVSIVNATTASTHESFDVSDARVTINTNTVTINPSTDFVGTNDYYVQIASTAITDASGNDFAGITGTTSWNYTTGDESAPIVNTYSPADNDINVS
ncbi:beta strand repeat-containing protein, partial [Bacteroidota bacterium]